MPKQKLEQYASIPWEGDNITLKAELIRAVKNWPALTADKDGNVPACPIHFSDEEAEQCLRIEAEQDEINLLMEKVRDRIGISTDGWTSNERYEDALEENEHVKVEALSVQDEATRNEILENWPFDDHGNIDASEGAFDWHRDAQQMNLGTYEKAADNGDLEPIM
jgi:hypothetical protein